MISSLVVSIASFGNIGGQRAAWLREFEWGTAPGSVYRLIAILSKRACIPALRQRGLKPESHALENRPVRAPGLVHWRFLP
jgi:hypothetical protein